MARKSIIPPSHLLDNKPQEGVRYCFQNIPLEHRDCERWPTAAMPSPADVKEAYPSLSDEQAAEHARWVVDRFDRFARGIRAYMATGSLSAALAEAQCDKRAFYAQLNRCLAPALDRSGGIVGWPALLFNLRLKTYTRVNEGTGTAGIFEKWLRDNPPWRDLLHRMILKGNGGATVAARKPDVRGVTRNFIAAFKANDPNTGKAKVPLGTYPHDGQDNGRRAIERYVRRYVDNSPACTSIWFGEDVAQRQHLGTGEQSFNMAVAPLDVLGADAHTVDALGIIILDGPSGPQRIPVKRLQIVAFVCHAKRVITGYSICIRPQIDAALVEQAFQMGTTPWAPKELTIEGLQYADGAGFPCGTIPGLKEVAPALIRFDNAAQHFSELVQQRMRQSTGCGIAWGGVGHWWRNALTERFFGTLERYGFQRLPSSMGNGPGDPQRADDPALEATGKGIEWHELVQLVDVMLANYNCKPHSALGDVSPLESMRAAMGGRGACWFPRVRPAPTANSPRLGVTVFRRQIAGSAANRVPPYVEICEARYTGKDSLSSRYDLIGRWVNVHVNEDARTAETYLDSGEFIGTLHCLHKGWALSPHSLQTRQAVNQLIRQGEMHVGAGGDPVVAYLEHLAKKARDTATTAKPGQVSADASALADELRAQGQSSSPALPAKRAANASDYKTTQAPGNQLPKSWA